LLPPPRAAPPPAPVPEHPREDLTERLRKEFGLNIDESDGEEGESGLDALAARLQGGARPADQKPEAEKRIPAPEEPARHRGTSEPKPRSDSWQSRDGGGSHRHREEGKGRERSEETGKGREVERKKVEKSGRAMAGLPNQGDRSRRPRTPLGSPTRRPSMGEGSGPHHGKDRGGEQARRNNSYSKNNHYAS
jgi:hypothetical protein